jgi:hypothetical protein
MVPKKLILQKSKDSRFKVKSEEARVHFIPNLKDGVFVTLCAPVVISILLSHTF